MSPEMRVVAPRSGVAVRTRPGGRSAHLELLGLLAATMVVVLGLTLAYLGGRKPEAPKSVIDRVTLPAPQTQETPPAPTTQQAPATDQPVEAAPQPPPASPARASQDQTSQPPQQ